MIGLTGDKLGRYFPATSPTSGTPRCLRGHVAQSLETAGFALRAQIIWDKTRLVIGRGDYHWQHEPAWYAVRKGKTGHWAGIASRRRSGASRIEIRDRPRDAEAYRMYEPANREQLGAGPGVYEPFSGTRTTIIAAEITGRAFSMELAPAYVDVAVHRWQAFTGEQARLASTDQVFEQVGRHRKAQPVHEEAL